MRYAIFRIPNLGTGYDNSPEILEHTISDNKEKLEMQCESMNLSASTWESYSVFQIDEHNRTCLDRLNAITTKDSDWLEEAKARQANKNLPEELRNTDLSTIKKNTRFGKYMVLVDEFNLDLGRIIVHSDNWPKCNGLILDLDKIEKHTFKPISTELSPQMKEHMAQRELSKKALDGSAKMLGVPKKYLGK